ncbi:MAG: electron transfer flavoprotein subunit alpha/FixB family protein [Bacteroidia bacterium]
MKIGVFAESVEGRFKKSAWEALTYARNWADTLSASVEAVIIGPVAEDPLQALGTYGAEKIYHVQGEAFTRFRAEAYVAALAAVAQEKGFSHIVLEATFNGKTLAPLLAIRWDAALVSQATALPEKMDKGWKFKRIVFSNKGIEYVAIKHPKIIVSVRPNSIVPAPKPTTPAQETFEFTPQVKDLRTEPLTQEKNTGKVSLTEAEIVVSAGRGLKDPANWKMVEELAEVLGAALACSKPVADIGWRPHHEHVGQTGIQIAPNLYIAIGISGAIQHLAGVGASKNIVVINNDPEAPFFKAADYGIVGDAFEVIPKFTQAIREYKQKHSH